MSISSALVAAQGRVADAYTAISNKGGTLPATQNLANMPTAINSIPSGGSSEKYGADANTFLGDVDANGVLQLPTEQSDLVFTGVKDVADYGLYYRFTRTEVKSASFPALTTISGRYGCGYMFQSCPSLTSVSFPNLTTISGTYGCGYMLQNSTALTSVSFPSLTTISGNFGCAYMLQNCTALNDVYFPALTTTSFGSNRNQFTSLMALTGISKAHTLHFPSNLESTIQGLQGYPTFGGTSGYVVCAFDLPATS